MTDLTNLANNYNDLYFPSIQKSVVEAYYKGDSIGNVINSVIKINNNRSKIKYGLYQRTKLKKSSMFQWDNPAESDGVPIFAKPSLGTSKVNNKLHTPFDRAIISTNAGYFAGKPMQIITESEDTDLSSYHLDSLLMEMTQTSIGRGSGFSLLSVQSGDVYINPISDWSSLVMYDYVTRKPAFGLVYEKQLSQATDEKPEETDTYKVWFYDKSTVTVGISSGNSFSITTPAEIHGFNDIPLVEFPNNTERIGDVELTMSLQDAYDIANSDLSSEISQLRLAYLKIINEGQDFSDEDISRLTQTGVLLLGENGDASFIEKSLNSTPVEQLKNDLEKDIFRYSLSYNPDESRGGDVTAFQIQQSMTKLEESAVEREKLFTLSIKRVINMLDSFLSLTGKGIGQFESVQYTRNIPSNIINDLKGMKESGLMLDQETLSDLAPFEIDYDKVVKRTAEQREHINEALMSEGSFGEIEEIPTIE